jgi:hypothetical protein
MAANRPHKSLADYVAIALCPVLIMALVGSLMFFLLEVLYAGPHDNRIRWACSAFIVGVVLIARISMNSDIAPRAGLYGVILAIVAGLVINKYIEYPRTNPLAPIGWLVNLGIMALVWWSAHRLTWDCTLIDDEADATGQGLLETAGLEAKSADSKPDEPASSPTGEVDEANDLALSWWERYLARRRNARHKPGQTPGVWIVYYSLAALPLFGLGQMMIPVSEAARRKYAFWLLAIYVAAGLGLLLATSFLGLRRYLRQRKLSMPSAMTGMWFMVGSALVAALLLLAFLLPRPSPEYYNIVNAFTGDQKKATRVDVLGGKGSTKGSGPETGKGASKKSGGQTPGKFEGKQGKQAEASSKDGSQKGDQPGGDNRGGRKGGDSKDGSGKQGDKSSDQSAKDRSKDSSGQSKGQSDKGDSKSEQGEKNERDPGDQRDEKGENDSNRKSEGQAKDSRKDGNDEQKKNEEESGGSQDDSPPTPPEETVDAPEPPSALVEAIKWIFYVLLCLVGLYVLIRHWRQILAMLHGLWQALCDLWARLLAGWPRTEAEADDGLGEPSAQPPPPFSSFTNPFLDGSAEARSPNYVTRYTFHALEAWAYERGLGRQPEETPLEFCQRIAADIPALGNNAIKLGEYYSRVCYARAKLGKPHLEPLPPLWNKMTAPVREHVAV